VQRVDVNTTSTSIYLVMVNPPPAAIGIVPQPGARKLAQQTRKVGKHTDAPAPAPNRRAASKGPGAWAGAAVEPRAVAALQQEVPWGEQTVQDTPRHSY